MTSYTGADHPNHVSDLLAAPGMLRGLLDAGVHEVTEELLLAVAAAIVATVHAHRIGPGCLLPSIFKHDVVSNAATAVRFTSAGCWS